MNTAPFLLSLALFLTLFCNPLAVPWDEILVNLIDSEEFFAPTTISFTIIIFCWRRLESLKRLVNSLLLSDFTGLPISIHFQVDGSPLPSVVDYVQNFVWPFGPKTIFINERHKGILKNVIFGWNPTSIGSYGIFFEDDIEVSPFFFKFLLATLYKYNLYPYSPSINNPIQFFKTNIGQALGISLYTPVYNELVYPIKKWNSMKFFHSKQGFVSCPALYRLQIPSSWGALYFPWWWVRLQQYYSYRISSKKHWLDPRFSVPGSSSNYWAKSWKKYLLCI